VIAIACCTVIAVSAVTQYHSPADDGAQAEAVSSRVLTVGTIEILGLQRYERDWFIKASGVASDQAITLTDLQAAAARLLNTGLFAKVADRYLITGSRIDVTWQIAEIEWGLPVLLDNFIWFSELDLWNAIARRVPSYDGTAPKTDGVVATITGVLQEMLTTVPVEGKVEHMLSVSPTGLIKHVFTVSDVPMPICGVTLTRQSDIGKDDLTTAANFLAGTDYSRHYILWLTDQNMLPALLRRGHLRATIGDPKVKAHSDEKCTGVHVTLAVVEGPRYTLGSIEWAGNSVLTAKALNAAMTLRAGDVADGTKLSSDIEAVQQAYGKIGHIAVKVSAKWVMQEGRTAATCRVSIEEGQQYRMGHLTISGLPEARRQRLEKQWGLAQGARYDATYLRKFVDFALRSGAATGRVGSKAVPDPNSLTVDVTINIVGT